MYNYFAPNGWYNLRTAEQKAVDALTKMRRDWYGLGWYLLDLWGRPLPPPEKPEPTNYEGIAFVRGMARKIAKGVIK